MKVSAAVLALAAFTASASATYISVDTTACNNPGGFPPVTYVVGTKPLKYLDPAPVAGKTGKWKIDIPADLPIPATTTPDQLKLRVYLSGKNGDKGSSTGLDHSYVLVDLPKTPSAAEQAYLGIGTGSQYEEPADPKNGRITGVTFYSAKDEDTDVFGKKLVQTLPTVPEAVGILFCRELPASITGQT